MLLSASCQIEISRVGDLLEVNCVCHGETEETPYNISVCAEVGVSELDSFLARCFLLFQGLVELGENESAQDWEPSEAALLLFSLCDAVEQGESFDMS